MMAMIRMFTLALIAGLASQAIAAWPVVSSWVAGTPGKWTDDYARTCTEAKRQRLPILLAIVDTRLSAATHTWSANVLESEEWREWLDSTKILLVWWDHETISRPKWEAVAKQFMVAGSLAIPQIVLIDPDGCKADQFCAINGEEGDLAEPDEFIGRLDEFIGEWPELQIGPGTVGFTANAVTVRTGAPAASMTVQRSGGDSAGRQVFKLETVALTNANAAVADVHYTPIATSLVWEPGDASERKIDIPLLNDGSWGHLADHVFGVRLTREPNSTAKIGITDVTVTVTSDFLDTTGWQATNVVSGVTNVLWYAGPFTNTVPAKLTWVAPQSGLLSFSAWKESTNDTLSLSFSGIGSNLTMSATNTIALAAGMQVSWMAAGTNGMFYVEMLEWQPITPPSLLSPESGKVFQYRNVMANAGLLSLRWDGAATNAGTYCLLFTGTTSNVWGPAITNPLNGVSGVYLGLTNGTYCWRVENVATGGLNTAVSAQSPIWSFEVTERPVFSVPFMQVSFYLGVPSAFTVQAEGDPAYPIKYSASDLPAGLKIDEKTGVVSGTATRQGVFNATVTADNGKGSASLAVTVVVDSFSAFISGSLQGVVTDAAGTLRGVFTMTVATSGKPSLKMEIDGKRKTLRGKWLDTSEFNVQVANFSDRTTSLDLTISGEGAFGKTEDGLDMVARRVLSGTAARLYAGYYTAVLDAQVTETGALDNSPEGSGYLTFTVTERNGTVRYSGKLADGTSVSGSASLVANSASEAMFPVYKTLYSRRGVVAALVEISQGITNTVGFASGTWQYPGKNASSADDSFGAELSGTGAVYVKRPTSLKWLDGATLMADGADIADLNATDRKVTVVSENGTRLNVAASSGLFSGNLRDATGKGRPFKGALVPPAKFGAGYWLLPDASASHLRLNRSHPVEIDASGTP